MAIAKPKQQTLDAVYEDGALRLLHPEELDLEEGQQVRVIVTPKLTPEEMTELAASVYGNLSAEEIAEIERISFDRSHFSGERPA